MASNWSIKYLIFDDQLGRERWLTDAEILRPPFFPGRIINLQQRVTAKSCKDGGVDVVANVLHIIADSAHQNHLLQPATSSRPIIVTPEMKGKYLEEQELLLDQFKSTHNAKMLKNS